MKKTTLFLEQPNILTNLLEFLGFFEWFGILMKKKRKTFISTLIFSHF